MPPFNGNKLALQASTGTRVKESRERNDRGGDNTGEQSVVKIDVVGERSRSGVEWAEWRGVVGMVDGLGVLFWGVSMSKIV